MLEPVMFVGGVYKHDLVIELVEDLGGYILQKNVAQSEVILLMLVPSEDMPAMKALSSELRGELTRAPLAGTEVVVVTPTLAIHHLPHTACDIAEYLRRNGAKSNMIGLARGVGREIAQINEYEAALINEHDAAVFIFGNFAECIRKKESLYRKTCHMPSSMSRLLGASLIGPGKQRRLERWTAPSRLWAGLWIRQGQTSPRTRSQRRHLASWMRCESRFLRWSTPTRLCPSP
jgi:hypothetical protein